MRTNLQCKTKTVAVIILLVTGSMFQTALWSSEEEASGTLPLNPLSPEVAQMTFGLDYEAKKIFVAFDVGDTGVSDKRMKVTCGIQKSFTPMPGFSVTMTPEKGRATGELPMPEPGQYYLVGALYLDDEKEMFFDIWKNVEIFKESLEQKAADLSEENAVISFSIDPDKSTVDVELDLARTHIPDEHLSGECAIVSANGKMPEKKSTFNFRRGKAKTTISLPQPPLPGKYDILINLAAKDGQKLELRQELVIPTTEWLGNKIGLEDKVLPPWTAMTKEGTTIKCWGREYVFGKGALPAQIRSAGKDLLSRPITLHAFKSGNKLAWELGDAVVNNFSETRAEVTDRVMIAGKEFNIRALLEYDGLVWFDISSDSSEPLPFDELSLEIPVKSEHAFYRHLFSIREVVLPGRIPDGNGIVETSKWMPFSWVGDNDRGLFWCCESAEMWPNKKGNAIEYIRNGKEVVLKLNIMKPGQTSRPDWNLSFGLQATPVKSYDARLARSMRIYGSRQNLDWVWPSPNSKYSPIGWGYFEANNPEYYQKRIDRIQSKGHLAIPYGAPTFILDGTPETIFFKKYWWFGFDDPYALRAGWKNTWYCASPAGKGFADFYVWKAKAFIEKYRLDGLYHDQMHPYAYSGKAAGVGYEENGIRYATYPIRAQRELFRRVYAVVKSQPRQTWLLAHMSAKMNISVVAYHDAYLDGEHPFAGLVRNDRSYMEVMDMDTFRAAFMGRQWGVAPVFLPQLRRAMADAVEPTRELMALLMVHDVTVCRLFCNNDVIDKAYDELDAFDYVNCDFIPYFDAIPPAASDMKNVYISAYKHDNGSVLLIAANLSKEKEDRKGKVKIDFERLGISSRQIMTWPGQKELKLEKDEVQMEVPKMDYRMIVIGQPVEIKLKPPHPFAKWTFTDLKLRAESMDYVHRTAEGVRFTGRDTGFQFYNPSSLKVLAGQMVVISFKARGAGAGHAGFFARPGGAFVKSFKVTDAEAPFKFAFDIENNTEINLHLWASKSADITISDYNVSIDENKEKAQDAVSCRLPGSAPVRPSAFSTNPSGTTSTKAEVGETKETDKNTAASGAASLVIPAGKKETNAPPANQGPFAKWNLVDAGLRAQAKDLVFKSATGVRLNGANREFWFFEVQNTPVKTGQEVKISFKAKGKGKGQVGFLTYTDANWTLASYVIKSFDVSENFRPFGFVFHIKDESVEFLRPVLGVHKSGDVTISDYKISVK